MNIDRQTFKAISVVSEPKERTDWGVGVSPTYEDGDYEKVTKKKPRIREESRRV